ncbi:MAG: hypothetical protein IPP06_09630 [Saprospiraceae bacterium]|nr:hypothetical protein [Candidatus Vicinibacter affinis]
MSGDRIKNDPAFARTRENMEEFKEINKAGKIIRGGFRNLIGRGADPRASSRLVGVLSKIMKYDTTSLRGERKVGIGLIDAVAKSLLSNFNFNQFAELDQIFKNELIVDEATGNVTISNFNPSVDLVTPGGSTHCAMECGWTEINFTTGETVSSISTESIHALDAPQSNVVLTPAQAPTGTGILMMAFKLSFYQTLNGRQYPLKNGSHNSLKLIHVG